MKSIKLASDTSLGVSLVVFSYVYWTAHRIESGSLSSWTIDEITNVTVNLFYFALLLSVVSIVCRLVVIKQLHWKNKLSWMLLIVATIPLMKWLFDMFAHA